MAMVVMMMRVTEIVMMMLTRMVMMMMTRVTMLAHLLDITAT